MAFTTKQGVLAAVFPVLALLLAVFYFTSRDFVSHQSIQMETIYNSSGKIFQHARKYYKQVLRTDPLIQQSYFRNQTAANRTRDSSVFLSIITRGRLGNQMCQFAALMGIALRNGFQPVLPNGAIPNVRKVFKMRGIPESLDIRQIRNFSVFHPTSSYDRNTENLTEYMSRKFGHEVNLRLGGYFENEDLYFKNIEELVRYHFFQPKDVYVEKVDKYMNNILSQNNCTIKVGIHIRRGDYLKGRAYKSKVQPAQYYLKGIEFFLRNFTERIAFFVACEDIKWARQNIISSRTNAIFFSPFKDYPLDFTLLYRCDHVIISYGTFSWWAGWLTPGLKITPYQVNTNLTYWKHIGSI